MLLFTKLSLVWLKATSTGYPVRINLITSDLQVKFVSHYTQWDIKNMLFTNLSLVFPQEYKYRSSES